MPKVSTFVQTATQQDTQWWSAEDLQRMMELDKSEPLDPFWNQVVNAKQYHLFQLGSNNQLQRSGVKKEATMFNTLVPLPRQFHLLLRFMSKIKNRMPLKPSREINLQASSSATYLLSRFVQAVPGSLELLEKQGSMA